MVVTLCNGFFGFFWQAGHLQRHILTPLSALLSLFPGPQKLIQKRYDKLLDYNSYLQRSAGDESDLARKEYEALNAQLVEELQVFNQAARKILLNCLGSFITLFRDLMLRGQQTYSTVVPVSAAPVTSLLGLLGPLEIRPRQKWPSSERAHRWLFSVLFKSSRADRLLSLTPHFESCIC
jgi:hypothetical protein